MSERKKIVIVSSTARDLPDHREEVMNACLRQSMFPKMMERLPASDADAIAVSLELVDEADYYVGIFAHRYGYVPKGYDISITEMEYNRAVELGIPRLIFLMHEDHPLKIGDVEQGEGAIKLKALKARLATERVANFFKSPADLRANVIDSLSHYREPSENEFHYISDIPKPPEIYIAHPYTLLQTRDLVGRQQELNALTDWVANPRSDVYQARIFNVVAIGGMGKSALTWKWFNIIAPNEMKPMAGRMWWSFYESDATFENFIIRALAYVTERAREDIEKNTKPGEREEMLLAALAREPFLLVLDGLERILIAYARMDANRLADDDFDQQTANYVAGALGLPESAAQSFTGQHLLRKTADPRAGNFLRKLARVRASRVLVSTRLYPADLQIGTGDSIPNSLAYFLRGLSDDDALSLWRAFGVSGSRDELLRLFQTFDKHPLLIHALASKIAKYRRAPGDYDRWQKDNTGFDPFSLPMEQRKSHILDFALGDLDKSSRKALHTIAALRMPASYDTLVAILVGKRKAFRNENVLDATLTELEDRGLLGWDKPANRYDLHPIVRGVVWRELNKRGRQSVYRKLQAYFESLPDVDEDNINTLEDLTPAIELYNTLIGLERYDDAFEVFYRRLDDFTLYRLSTNRQRAELLEMLFSFGMDPFPHLSNPTAYAAVTSSLALAYDYIGQSGRAIPLHRTSLALATHFNNLESVISSLANLADALSLSGALRESEATARHVLLICRKQKDRFREAVSLRFLGLVLAARGVEDDATTTLRRSCKILLSQGRATSLGVTVAFQAQWSLRLGLNAAALFLADRAWELAVVSQSERDIIRAVWVQGAVVLEIGNLEVASERLYQALARAHAVQLVREELQALITLSELQRRQGDLQAARELLDDVWESAKRGPYPLYHADALNVLAQIERDAGNLDRAVEAATNAYRKAWCDGPPFAYHWGLEAARAHLKALGAPEPADLPPYDESKYEPMLEVEIDPPDLPVEPDSTEED